MERSARGLRCERRSARGRPGIVGRRSVLLALVALLAAGATALAAHPKDAALYSGSINKGCKPARLCHAVFRVSRDGKTMSLQGGTAFAVSCPGGGGEFFISTRKSDLARGALPAPLVTIHASGKFDGARTVRRGSVEISYRFTGRFTGSGTTLVFRVLTGRCSSLKYTLKAH